MIKKKLNKQHLSYQLAKWVLLIPSVLFLFVYVFGFMVELIRIKATKPEHTKNDVANARKWFIYLALPLFPDEYFFDMWHSLDNDQLKRMVDVYGKRSFNKWLKMYYPFMKKKNALDAFNLKTGNTLEFVQ